MKVPPDGWDADERDVPEDLARELSNLADASALPIEVLRAAGTGVLPEALDRDALDYLSRQPRARALIDALNDESALDPHSEARLLARISREATVAVPRTTSAQWIWGAAAALAAIAIGGSLWMMRPNRTSEPAAAVAQAPADARAPEATTASKAPETFLLPLERPNVRISLRALTWRGAPRENPVLAALKSPFDAFRAGDYAAADRAFTDVGRQYPDLIEVALYQGIARLFVGDVAGATTSLRAAEKIADPAFMNDVAWYLAIAEERSGNPAAARARLEGLCTGGAGDARACAALARP